MFAVRQWRPFQQRTATGTETQAQWVTIEGQGHKENIRPDTPYAVRATLAGSRVTLHVDGIHLLSTEVPSLPPQDAQSGLWCRSRGTVIVKGFQVKSKAPRAFVVMQLSPPFDDMYLEVIKAVSNEFGLDALRADEMYGPGVIIRDIINQVVNAQLVIADISAANANVYFEVGYALALNKPIVLLAKKGTELPFDVSGFRVLFYEDSIGGKAKVEEGLRNHLRAIRGDVADS